MSQELYIIRHGETEANKQGIIQGRGINLGLNEHGVQQAQAFFEQYKGQKFDHVITSTLLRAKQTVEPFRKIGHDIHHYAELDEIGWGIFEGHPSDPEMRRVYNQLMKDWQNGNLDAKVENGESANEMHTRHKRFVLEILPKYEGKILICSHGRTIRSLLCALVFENLSKMDRFPHQNLSLYKLQKQNGKFRIVEFNNREHLAHIPVAVS